MPEMVTKIIELLSPYTLYIAVGAVALVLVLLILVIILLVKYSKLNSRMSFFMRDTKSNSMEETLHQVLEDNRAVKDQMRTNIDDIATINENLISAYRKIGVVKYNAFPGMAGKMSASIALLNNENNGIIINTLHGQEGCYTYVKEIMNGKSINPLTKEDEDALKMALQLDL